MSNRNMSNGYATHVGEQLDHELAEAILSLGRIEHTLRRFFDEDSNPTPAFDTFVSTLGIGGEDDPGSALLHLSASVTHFLAEALNNARLQRNARKLGKAA